MGANTFEVVTKGFNAKEAFKAAVDEAIYEYGNGSYSGTIKEKDSFVVISLPKGKEPLEYAYELIEKNDSRVSDKWGAAGCILMNEEKTLVDESYATTESGRVKLNGARKWETKYTVYELDFMKAPTLIKSHTSQTDAEKFAKKHAISNNVKTSIEISKVLVNGKSELVTFAPKTKKVNGKESLKTYLFFGWASS